MCRRVFCLLKDDASAIVDVLVYVGSIWCGNRVRRSRGLSSCLGVKAPGNTFVSTVTPSIWSFTMSNWWLFQPALLRDVCGFLIS